MHRSLRFIAALLLGAAVGCQNEGLSPAAVRPSFATGAASPTCAANPTVTVSDDTTLRAALKAARPGDVIAVSGTIEVTADDTIATDNVTLTCATPGSGLVARGLEVVDMVTVTARGVAVDGLVLDGSRAFDAPWFAFNDGETAFAQDVRFTNNTVTCTLFGACAFVVGGTGAVVSDNQFQATDAFTGVHLQANGPDPNVVFPIRIDGARDRAEHDRGAHAFGWCPLRGDSVLRCGQYRDRRQCHQRALEERDQYNAAVAQPDPAQSDQRRRGGRDSHSVVRRCAARSGAESVREQSDQRSRAVGDIRRPGLQ